MRIVRAGQPSNFIAEMSKATYADSVYYGTTYSLEGLPVDGSLPVGHPSNRPAPFPPLNLWCVYLGASGRPAAAIAFIGEHHDIYNADYILHEAVDAQAVLASVGCPASL